MKVNEKDWSSLPKQEARWETIISQYRASFCHSLPRGRQYWTMAGQCANDDGSPRINSEVWQMLQSGLVTPDQFHGVEINPDIHALNVAAYPSLSWHNDDFYRAMVKADAANAFHPAIVNADLIHTPETSIGFISKIIAHLTDVGGDMLFVTNFVIRTRHYTTKEGGYVVEKLNRDSRFVQAFNHGRWIMKSDYYPYSSAGSRTWMGTLVFTKKAVEY